MFYQNNTQYGDYDYDYDYDYEREASQDPFQFTSTPQNLLKVGKDKKSLLRGFQQSVEVNMLYL
jgi:hypothetical protein